MTGRTINRDEWPADGDHRALLALLDRVHKQNGVKSLREIGEKIPLSHTAVGEVLRGRRLPTDGEQVAAIVRAMGGGSDHADMARVHLNAARKRVRQSGPDRARVNVSNRTTTTGNSEDDSSARIGDFVAIEELLQPAMDVIDAVASRYEKPILHVPTPFPDLNSLIGGIGRGHLIVIAGQSGVGKTTLALDLVRHTAIKTGVGAGFVTLESSSQETTIRLLSAECRIKLVDIRSGLMDDDDWTRMARRMSEISEAPIMIHDATAHELEEIRLDVERLCMSQDLWLLVVDGIELIRAKDRPRDGRDSSLIAHVLRELKVMAQLLNLTFVVTTQLPDKSHTIFSAPEVSELRDPALKELADLLILLDRPDLHDRTSDRAGEIDIIVAKYRQGPTGLITVAHQLHYCRLMPLAH